MSALVRVENLHKVFAQPAGLLGQPAYHTYAVNGVSFGIEARRTLGLVGESGCGKSTLARLVIGLLTPTRGRVWVGDLDLATLRREAMQKFRKRMQMVFQDPYSSLNPRMKIARIVAEPLVVHAKEIRRDEIAERLAFVIQKVGLSLDVLKRYPHELSGGQRQRAAIARAIILNPEFVVCDEPLSALDVSIQSQIINVLKDLQKDMGLTYLFISHDVRAVSYISHDVAVMYLGRFMEMSKSADIYRSPLHPYTQCLLAAVPEIAAPKERRQMRHYIDGEVPSPIAVPSGCVFHPRCPRAKAICAERVPDWREVSAGHYIACHLV